MQAMRCQKVVKRRRKSPRDQIIQAPIFRALILWNVPPVLHSTLDSQPSTVLANVDALRCNHIQLHAKTAGKIAGGRNAAIGGQ